MISSGEDDSLSGIDGETGTVISVEFWGEVQESWLRLFLLRMKQRKMIKREMTRIMNDATKTATRITMVDELRFCLSVLSESSVPRLVLSASPCPGGIDSPGDGEEEQDEDDDDE